MNDKPPLFDAMHLLIVILGVIATGVLGLQILRMDNNPTWVVPSNLQKGAPWGAQSSSQAFGRSGEPSLSSVARCAAREAARRRSSASSRGLEPYSASLPREEEVAVHEYACLRRFLSVRATLTPNQLRFAFGVCHSPLLFPAFSLHLRGGACPPVRVLRSSAGWG